jgi:hypothetical protein
VTRMKMKAQLKQKNMNKGEKRQKKDGKKGTKKD